MKQKSTSNYDFFVRVDTSPYKGEWIAISKDKIVAHGKDAQEVYKRAQLRSKNKNVSLAKVPEEQVLVLSLKLSP